MYDKNELLLRYESSRYIYIYTHTHTHTHTHHTYTQLYIHTHTELIDVNIFSENNKIKVSLTKMAQNINSSFLKMFFNFPNVLILVGKKQMTSRSAAPLLWYKNHQPPRLE